MIWILAWNQGTPVFTPHFAVDLLCSIDSKEDAMNLLAQESSIFDASGAHKLLRPRELCSTRYDPFTLPQSHATSTEGLGTWTEPKEKKTK